MSPALTRASCNRKQLDNQSTEISKSLNYLCINQQCKTRVNSQKNQITVNYWYMYSDLKTKIQLCSSIISLTFSLIHISTLSTCSLNMRMSFSSTRPFPLLLEACRSSFHLELSLCKLCLTLSDSGCFFLSNTSPSYQKQFRS